MNALENNKIYTFKLTTGEEIVARLISQDAHQGFMTISYPILTVPSQQGLQMMPALFSADLRSDIRLNAGAWVMISPAREDVGDRWIEATTGIAPVSKKIITG